MQQERELIEEIQKQNKDREIAKKIALEKWHQQKREEDRRRKLQEKVRIKTERKFPLIEFGVDKFRQYDPKFKKRVNANAMIHRGFDQYHQDQQALAAKEWMSKKGSGSRHFSIHDFIVASAFKNSNSMDLSDICDPND